MECRLKKPFRLFKKWQFYICVIIFSIFIKMSFGYFSNAVHLYIYQKSRSYAEGIISKTINEEFLPNFSNDGFILKTYDNNNKITMASLDTYKANLVRAEISKTVNDCIISINEQEDFNSLMIPLGYFFSRNYFLANGVRVPINLEIIGSAKTDIIPKVEAYGINSSLIEISLQIKIEMNVMIPFQQQRVEIDYQIPLAIEIINSDVPFMYT